MYTCEFHYAYSPTKGKTQLSDPDVRFFSVQVEATKEQIDHIIKEASSWKVKNIPIEMLPGPDDFSAVDKNRAFHQLCKLTIYQDGSPIFHTSISGALQSSDTNIGVSLTAIKELLINYTKDEYENPGELRETIMPNGSLRFTPLSPYQEIASNDNSEIRVRQYLSVLRKDAAAKGANEELVEEHIAETLGKYHGKNAFNDVANAIRDIITDEYYKDQVVMCPFMCGSGKSTAISQIIKWTLQKNILGFGNDGLIIVTDSILRMKEYIKSDYNPEVKQFLDDHKEMISIIEQENAQSEIKHQKHCPVVIMTTQRFTNYTVEEIQDNFGTWDGGKRTVTIIDELIPLYEQVTLSRLDVWRIMGILYELIVVPEEEESKAWCINQWHVFANRFCAIVADNEKAFSSSETKEGYYYCQDEQPSLTEDDARFAKFLRTHKTALQSIDTSFDLDKKIRAFTRFLDSGGLFAYSAKSELYRICNITVCVDNTELLTKSKQQMLIMDGTGNLNPNYDLLKPYLYPSSDYDRRLDNLTIRFMNLDTSKKAFGSKNIDIVQSVMETLKANKVKAKQTVLFTYKNWEKQFKGSFRAVDHFGAIKGKNEYSESNCIVQVGLNVYADKEYLVHALMRDDDTLQQFKGIGDHTEADKYIHEYIEKERKKIESISTRIVLSDIEQNLFRSAIRVPDYTDGVMIYIFCDTVRYKPVIDLARQRYARYGAKIQVYKAIVCKVEKKGKGSIMEARFMKYWDSLAAGQGYTRDDICNAMGCTSRQFTELRNRSNAVREILQKDKIPGEKHGKHFIKS